MDRVKVNGVAVTADETHRGEFVEAKRRTEEKHDPDGLLLWRVEVHEVWFRRSDDGALVRVVAETRWPPEL